MKVEKKHVIALPAVYATAEVQLSGKRYFVAASEARDEHVYLIDPETLSCSDLWVGDTGVMNVVQIPQRDELLAITKFYPIFQSKEAAICHLKPGAEGYLHPWDITEKLKLPFCHRIGIVQNDNGLFVIGCQLCRDKDFQEDWTQPGSIWMAPIPDTADGEWQLTEVFTGLTKNHGLFIQNGNQVYICSEDGVLLFDMSRYHAGDQLLPTLISTTPTSDIWIQETPAACFAGTIEPFHGNTAAVYRMKEQSFEKAAEFPIDFGHVVWAGSVFGQNALILGNRGGERALELVFWETGERLPLDSDIGPTQITVIQEGEQVTILSANHGAGSVDLYILTR